MIETTSKERYLSPQCEVLETATETILALSPTFNNPFGEEQNW